MDSGRLSYLFTAVGVGFVALALTQFLTADLSTIPRFHIVSNLLVTGGVGTGLIYTGYWHSQRSFEPAQIRRILGWTVGGCVVLTAETIITQPLVQERITRSELVHILQVNVGTGLLFGAIAGSYGARALANAETAARAEARLEALENEQEYWNQLNTVLRHYILNSVTVINYRIDQLRSAVRDDAHLHLDTIADRMQTIATIGTHVDRLGPSLREEEDSCSTVSDLQAVFEAAIARAEISAPVTIDTPPAGKVVCVGDGIENDLALLVEALASVMHEDGTITCTCTSTADTITCQVTATPAELPPAVEAAIFEPIERKSGLKLYLAKVSMDTYAELELRQNCDETVQFEIIFDKATDAET
ncbi:hypothetical protein HLRTI_001512 [Halorhabdus tiamatea SARL4B]|uniref:Conserved hypothetical membrane protein n=1 Tax=Halorhabdus tiamatea SARL4B TaxID=1033806 RepID=F7PFL3_9EURY|nr:hypothetical protein [Halorhabdus tiamatea]ERJ06433.1 hypothetical protein HLRTI_001512 [Halorhabdus tiamatea SARL4B]CCQ34327.1 conserved hypothetical membrane protein [Halorhabdus tiamatea SARL4B]